VAKRWQAERNTLLHKHLRHVEGFANPEKLAKSPTLAELVNLIQSALYLPQ